MYCCKRWKELALYEMCIQVLGSLRVQSCNAVQQWMASTGKVSSGLLCPLNWVSLLPWRFFPTGSCFPRERSLPGSGSNLSISGVRALTKPLNAYGKHMLFMLKIMTDEYTCIAAVVSCSGCAQYLMLLKAVESVVAVASDVVLS